VLFRSRKNANGLQDALLPAGSKPAGRSAFLSAVDAYRLRSVLENKREKRMKIKTVLSCGALLVPLLMLGCGGTSDVSNHGDNRLAMNTNRDNAAVYSTNTNSNSNMSNSMANANANSASSDTNFIQEAAMGGMAEVELGRLAATKAVNAEVKKFGQMMVQDHSKANEDLKALAAKKNMTVPIELNGDKKSTMEELRGETGAEFDREYVEEMVDDHEEDVAAFEKQAQSATDPDVKAFATKTLPVLKKHLDAIKAIQAKMK